MAKWLTRVKTSKEFVDLIILPFQIKSLYILSYQYIMHRFKSRCKWVEYSSAHKGTIPRQKYSLGEACFHAITFSNPMAG